MDEGRERYKVVWVNQESERQGQSREPLTLALAKAWRDWGNCEYPELQHEIAVWDEPEEEQQEE